MRAGAGLMFACRGTQVERCTDFLAELALETEDLLERVRCCPRIYILRAQAHVCHLTTRTASCTPRSRAQGATENSLAPDAGARRRSIIHSGELLLRGSNRAHACSQSVHEPTTLAVALLAHVWQCYTLLSNADAR